MGGHFCHVTVAPQIASPGQPHALLCKEILYKNSTRISCTRTTTNWCGGGGDDYDGGGVSFVVL